MSDVHKNCQGHTVQHNPHAGCPQQHSCPTANPQVHHGYHHAPQGYPAIPHPHHHAPHSYPQHQMQPQPCKVSRFRKVLSMVLSKQLWQRALHCVVYFAASLIVLNDLFLMLARTFVPDCFPGARVIVLEILLQSLTKIISAGGV